MARLVFRKYGGSIQLSIKNFDDLEKAVDLPETLWVAIACPTTGLACDQRFLGFLDTDKNGRIRADELKAAIRWVGGMLDDTRGVDGASSELELGWLSEEAGDLRKSAELVQEVLGLEGGKLSLAQVRSSDEKLRGKGYNGDGIVAPETVASGELAALAKRILEVLPGATNRAGKVGVDPATIQAFREGKAKGIARMDARPEVFAWGEGTLAKADQLAALAPKLDEYFLQCRLVAVQPETSPLLRLPGDRVPGTLGDREALDRATAALLIAPPNAQGELRWGELFRGPSHEALVALRDEVFAPLLGERTTLSEADYRGALARAQRAIAWRKEAEDDRVIALENDLRAVDDGALDRLAELCARDLALKPRLDALESLEKLLLCQRWLLSFANNFIAMPDLYSTKRKALFEQGRLILSGRLFTLAVHVPDRASHAALASTNTMCLAYLKLERQGAAPTEVAVPVTAGTSQGVAVGKRGIFYDRDDNEYDATVTQVVSNPVSLWEAMTSPFARIGKFVSSKVQSFGESGDKAMEAKLAAAPAAVPATPPPAGAAPASPMGGTIAAGGLAFAAVGSAAAFIVNQLKGLTILDLVRATLAIVLLIMFPAGVLGWWKLRQRNLAILLEGSGWALNDRLLLTKPLGRLFTRRPPRPAGSSVDRTDLIPIVKVSKDDEEESSPKGALVTLLVLAVLATLAWEFRAPITSGVKLLLPPPAASSAAPPAASPLGRVSRENLRRRGGRCHPEKTRRVVLSERGKWVLR